jgi:hypothetical protein
VTFRSGTTPLGLVLNAVVLWTTRYIDAAVAQLRAEGHEIRDEDIARLSPARRDGDRYDDGLVERGAAFLVTSR